MESAFICEGIRTPIGRYGGALAQVRTDDLAAHPLTMLRSKFESSDWASIDEVLYGCSNQAGEDNRNVGRMASLLAGVPHTVPAATVNRLCGSGMEAVSMAARGIAAGEISLAIAGGVESAAQASRKGEAPGIFQRRFHSAVAARGKPGDRARAPARARR